MACRPGRLLGPCLLAQPQTGRRTSLGGTAAQSSQVIYACWGWPRKLGSLGFPPVAEGVDAAVLEADGGEAKDTGPA